MKIGFLRLNNIQNLTNDLPFQLVHWPAIYTRPCPQNRHGHKTERGLAVAHYHIWLDFIFFDHDVLDELAKGSIHGEYTSTTWTSTSGIFTAYDNGTLYKNGKPFSEDDILVIFEDDAISAIKDCNTTMIEELSDMSTDFLYLGWCEGRLARPVPLCSHSYAVTRRGARKLAKYFEPCGMAIDEQFVKFAKNDWISYRTAHPFSYNNNYKEGFPEPGVKNYGDPMVTGTVSLGILNAISLYSNVLLVRFALSWFPQLITQFPILRPVLVVTDPYLRVFRQVIPPVGGFDISSIAALFALNILSNTAAAIGDEGPNSVERRRSDLDCNIPIHHFSAIYTENADIRETSDHIWGIYDPSVNAFLCPGMAYIVECGSNKKMSSIGPNVSTIYPEMTDVPPNWFFTTAHGFQRDDGTYRPDEIYLSDWSTKKFVGNLVGICPNNKDWAIIDISHTISTKKDVKITNDNYRLFIDGLVDFDYFDNMPWPEVFKSGSRTGVTRGNIFSWGHIFNNQSFPNDDFIYNDPEISLRREIFIQRRHFSIRDLGHFADEGDSGGPVLAKVEEKWKFIGLVKASLIIHERLKLSVVTPIDNEI
eukprot:gene19840-25789_t